MACWAIATWFIRGGVDLILGGLGRAYGWERFGDHSEGDARFF